MRVVRRMTVVARREWWVFFLFFFIRQSHPVLTFLTPPCRWNISTSFSSIFMGKSFPMFPFRTEGGMTLPIWHVKYCSVAKSLQERGYFSTCDTQPVWVVAINIVESLTFTPGKKAHRGIIELYQSVLWRGSPIGFSGSGIGLFKGRDPGI